MKDLLYHRLSTLSVSHAMRKGVVPVFANQTMTQAAVTLADNAISGAPVLDETGQCVGILSANDFVRREASLHDASRVGSRGSEYKLAVASDYQPLLLEETAGDLVAAHMSTGLQTIPPAATLAHAARIMCAAHVHRLPVVDEGGIPIGMLTSLDIVSALVNALEEAT